HDRFEAAGRRVQCGDGFELVHTTPATQNYSSRHTLTARIGGKQSGRYRGYSNRALCNGGPAAFYRDSCSTIREPGGTRIVGLCGKKKKETGQRRGPPRTHLNLGISERHGQRNGRSREDVLRYARAKTCHNRVGRRCHVWIETGGRDAG